MRKLSEDLEGVYDVLVSQGLQIRRETYDPTHFGNAMLELSSPDMCVQFIRDRGQTMVNLQGVGKRWVSLETLLEYMGEDLQLDFDVLRVGSALAERLEKIRGILADHGEYLADSEARKRSAVIRRFTN